MNTMRRHIKEDDRAARRGTGQPGWWVALSLLAVLGLLLAACVAPVPVQPEAPARVLLPTALPVAEVSLPATIPTRTPPLVGTPWVLVALGDQADLQVVEPGSVVTATFAADGTVSGSAGCNAYSAPYTVAGDRLISVGPVVATLKACPTGMDQEQAFLQALESVRSYTITADGRLRLSYSTGGAGATNALVFAEAATPLANTLWVLEAAGAAEDPQPVPAGILITATFQPAGADALDGVVVGSAGCNDYTAGYVVDDGRIIVRDPAATRKLCPSPAMDQEQAFLQALSDAERYTITGPRLELSYDGGRSVLQFSSLHLPLENTLWRLAAIGGELVALELDVTAIFVPGDVPGLGTVSGTGGCNSYSGSYTTFGQQLTVGALAATKKLCPVGSELEAAYLAMLQAANSYSVLGDRLEITTADGTLVYLADRTPLEEATWELVYYGSTARPIAVIAGSDTTARFERESGVPSGLVTGSTGCNDYSAAYAATFDEIAINQPATTRQACPAGLDDQEQQFLQRLAAAESYRILGNTLQLFSFGGLQTLTFVAAGSVIPIPPTLTPVPPPPVQVLSPTAVLDMPSKAQAYQAVVFSGNRSIAGTNPIVAYRWDFGDGRTASGATIQRSYPKPGTYTVTLTVVDSAGLSDSTSSQIRIVAAPVGPTAVIDGPSQAVVGQSVTFTSRSQPGSSAIVSYAWDLTGASRTARTRGSSVTTVYNTPGTFRVSLTVTDANGLSDTTTKQIQILPAVLVGPTAAIEGPSQAVVGQPVTFTSQSKQGSSPIVSYAWDLTGGPRTAGTQGSSVTTMYNTPGTYTVSLTVTDQNGLRNTAVQQIQILPAAQVGPTAVIEGPSQAVVGQSVTFTSKSKQGSSPIVSYAWDLTGGARTTGTQGSSVTTVYNTPGTYTVSLTVTDQNGLRNTAVKQIQILPAAQVGPTAVIEGPSQAVAGQSVTFTSRSQPGSSAIVSYAWDLSGMPRTSGGTQGSSVTTVYNTPGTYTVSLTVTDKNGLRDTDTKQIQILPAAPVLPTPVISAPREAMAGQPVTFDGSQSRPGNGGDIVSYEWRFGDGGSARGAVVQYAYGQPGNYGAVLIVTDASGRSNNTVHNILVKAAPPPPTASPTSTPTAIPTSTPTAIPTSTPTAIPTPTPTDIPTSTPTAIPTPTPTAIPIGPGLEGTLWTLGSAMPGTTITLQLNGGSASGSAGCNNYTGSYTASGGPSGAISFSGLTTGMMACEQAVMAQEQQYLAALGTAISYKIEGQVLTLATGLGPLTYFAQGAPTPR